LVTHRLGEIGEFCDDVTVFRGGEVAYEGQASELSNDELVARIVGPDHGIHELATAQEAPPRFAPTTAATQPRLEVRDLRGKRLRGLSLTVAAGEVVGLTGTVEGDSAEAGRLIAGVRRRSAGEVKIDGTELSPRANPRAALVAGLTYLPADRLKESGIGALSVRENIALPNFGGYWGRRRAEDEDISLVLQRLDVRPPNPEKMLASFSGGNQQKALLGKWLLRRPRVLVLDSPTIGVDPGAREQIFRLLRGLALVGTGVLLISNEAEHLARVCDRVVVLDEGVVKAEVTGDNLTEEAIRFAGLR
jgi:ribose transport system ATP-binding protein